MNPEVDFYFTKATKWQEELKKLRSIVLECHLNEELKWGCPCYTFEKNNIVLIHAFKEYCALLFFKGVLMKDPKGLLIQQTKNVQSARQIRFTNVQEITKIKAVIKRYILNAVEVEESGAKVSFKKDTGALTEEFQAKLKKDPALKKAFEKLTPGRQRAYNLFFSSAKQSQTRESRIEKCIPAILEGKGLND